MFLLKQAYAQRRQGSEHGPWDTERHRSTGPSSHGRHRTWHYSLRRGFGDRVCLGPIWWDEPIHVHLSCIYMYMHVEIHTRVLRNIIHIYIHISLLYRSLQWNQCVWDGWGWSCIPHAFWALVAQEFGPTLSKSKPRLSACRSMVQPTKKWVSL